MKTNNNFSDKELIKKAHHAMQAGKSNVAREFALLAVEKYPDNEQAWLILASLSKPEQALLYLENALRINPDSQAARKGIRLIYSQISMKSASGFNAEKTHPSLSDIAPIHIKGITEEEKEEKNQDSFAEKSELEAEISEDLKAESVEKENKEEKQAKTQTHPSKKEILRSRLMRKPASIDKQSSDEESPVEIGEGEVEQAEPEDVPASEDISVQADQETEPEKDTEQPSPDAESQVEIGEDEVEQTEPEDVPTSEDIIIEPESEKITEQPPIDEEDQIKISEEEADQVESEKIPLNEITVTEPVQEGNIDKSDREQIEEPDLKKQEPVTPKEKIAKKNKKTMDVDTIELILVAAAVILLPLLAFLYYAILK